MCGIAGFINLQRYHQNESELAARLKKMTNAIAHRGPDGEGFFLDAKQGIGLGHRRLAILDLSDAGKQPMTYEDSGVWICLNGEIYNYLELRDELRTKGYRFRTSTDTEVVLAAFLEWDLEAFNRFNGMWSLVLADSRKRRAIACVDRFGVKPLFFRRRGAEFEFASEQKAFWALDDGADSINWDLTGVSTALVSPGTLEASGRTLFDGIESLQGGQFIEIAGESFKKSRWWSTGDHLQTVPHDLKQQAEQFKELFFDACKLRLRSDVPIGTALSGGLDSSAVAAVLGQIRRSSSGVSTSIAHPHKAFIHEFKGTVLDESRYAKIVTDEVGLEPVLISANEAEVIQHLDEMILGFESIYHGLADAPGRVYQAQRAHGCYVSLDGHGADEMLGGYHNYTYGALRQAFPNLKKVNSYITQLKEQSGAFFSWRSIAVGLLSGVLPPLRPTAASFAVRKLAHPVLAALTPPSGKDAFYSLPPITAPPGFDIVNQALYEDFHQKLLPRILKNFDLSSMAHGVEVRMPFMDYRLVSYVFSLPSESKIGQGYTKLVLREALKGILPDEISRRKLKLGFNSPLLEWLPKGLSPWVENTLTHSAPFDVLIDRSKLLTFYKQRVLTGRFSWSDATRFWSMVSAVRLSQLLETKVLVG